MALRGFASFLPVLAFALVFGAALPASAQRGAISGETFTAGTTGALARVCGATAQESAYAAAIHFWHGVLVASGQARGSRHKRQGTRPAFCLPTPSPTLDQVAASFVAWSAANPQFEGMRAADGLMRNAAAQYPCAARLALLAATGCANMSDKQRSTAPPLAPGQARLAGRRLAPSPAMPVGVR